MRRKLFICLILCLCILSGCGVRSTDIVVKKTDVNNRYHNGICNVSNELIQIDDTIYYNYPRDCMYYGTYEIKTGSLRRVHWDGFKLYPNNISLDDVYQNRIYKDNALNLYWDFENDTLIEDTDIPPCKVREDGTYETLRFFANDDMYYFSDSELDKWDEDKGFSRIASSSDLGDDSIRMYISDGFYISDSFIDYIVVDDKKDQLSYCLKRFDIASKKIVNQISFGEIFPGRSFSSSDLISDGDNVFALFDGVVLYRFNYSNNSAEKIIETNSVIYMNCYNHSLYYGVMHEKDAGIYKIDYNGKAKPEKIYDMGVQSVYILDDDYVYFTDTDGNLFRITTDGKIKENVFIR